VVVLLCATAALCNLELEVLQSAIAVNGSATVTWTRQSGDPTDFKLQSILFATSLSYDAVLVPVSVDDSQTSGNVSMVSRFPGSVEFDLPDTD
jgi:hypothetical protein